MDLSHTLSSEIVYCCWSLNNSHSFHLNIYHLYFQQLFLVGGVHLLESLFQLMVPVEERFPQLCCQMEICQNRGKTGKHKIRGSFNAQTEAMDRGRHMQRVLTHTHKHVIVSHYKDLVLTNHTGILGMPWDVLVTLTPTKFWILSRNSIEWSPNKTSQACLMLVQLQIWYEVNRVSKSPENSNRDLCLALSMDVHTLQSVFHCLS